MGGPRLGVVASLSVWGIVLPRGFSCNEFRLLRLESFFFPPPIFSLPREDPAARWATADGMGRFPVCRILCLMLVGFGALWFFALFLCHWLWVQRQCLPATQTWLLFLSLWSDLPSGGCTLAFHYYHVHRGCGEFWVACGFCLCPFPSPSSLYCSLRYSYLQMSRVMSQMCLCWAENLLLNYSYPTCNFKGRDLDILSFLHATDVLDYLFNFEILFYYL